MDSRFDPTAPPDSEVIRLSLEHPERFGELFDRHYAAILRFGQRRLGSEIGEEIAAETFAQAFRARGRFDDSRANDSRPWLFGIASNLIRMHSRTEIRRLRAYARAQESDDADFTDALVSRVDADSKRSDLYVAVSNLSKRDRDVVLLHVLADLSLVEVAAALEIPEGTARSRLARARKLLSRSMGDEGGTIATIAPEEAPR